MLIVTKKILKMCLLYRGCAKKIETQECAVYVVFVGEIAKD
jgi:hypothetical protein